MKWERRAKKREKQPQHQPETKPEPNTTKGERRTSGKNGLDRKRGLWNRTAVVIAFAQEGVCGAPPIWKSTRTPKAALIYSKPRKRHCQFGIRYRLPDNRVLIDYSRPKGTIVSFTRSFALDPAEKVIQGNALAPGRSGPPDTGLPSLGTRRAVRRRAHPPVTPSLPGTIP